MSMRSATDGRRLYTRNGSLVACYLGKYFGPKGAKGETNLNGDKEVKIEALKASGGKAKIQVTQGKTSEEWIEKELTFAKRGSKRASATA